MATHLLLLVFGLRYGLVAYPQSVARFNIIGGDDFTHEVRIFDKSPGSYFIAFLYGSIGS